MLSWAHDLFRIGHVAMLQTLDSWTLMKTNARAGENSAAGEGPASLLHDQKNGDTSDVLKQLLESKRRKERVS